MKRKGFTLVELLAVLAVLAIMIILVLPNVLKLFNDSKKKSFETEIKEIYKTAQEKWMMESLHKKEERYYSRTATQECVNQLNLSGRTDLDYFIKLDKKGNVVLFKAKDANYQYYYSGPGLKIDELKDVVQISKIDDDEVLIVTCSGLAPNYYNVTLDKKYEKLQDAIDEASSNQTIKLLGPIEYESTPFVVPEDMNPLIIDFNGYVLVYNYQLEEIGVNNGNLILTNSNNIDGDFGFEPWSYMTNNGTLTIKKGAGVNSENDAIINNGTLNIEGGSVHGRESSCITNNGTINMSSGYVGAYITAIDNKSGGVVNLTGGEVSSIYAISNASGAQLNISNGALVHGLEVGISNSGTLTANNCTINIGWVTDGTGIINSGTATLTNTNITVTPTDYRTSIGIKNEAGGTLTFNSGTITSNIYHQAYGVYNEGTFVMNNGTINSGTNNMSNYSSIGVYSTGQFTIKEGTVLSPYIGMRIPSGTLTLGVNNSSVSTTSPLINAPSVNGVGIIAPNAATINFYDGIVKASRGTDSSITLNGIQNSSVTPRTTFNTRSGYTVKKETVSGVEQAYLTAQ